VLPKDTDHAAALRRRAEGLGDRVAVLGHVADPQARMRTWTVAVSASVEPEACPLNVLEAMSLGIPVVASDHGGTPEVLAGSGRLVPPGDPAALAAAIVRLLDDPGERRRCAEAGRHRVATAHQWDVQVARLLDVLAAEAAA
jgi:glycosyltransferase involved in cell wall biosynthesis